MSQLLEPFKHLTPRSFETSWSAPSNIAFIKYWGKKGPQLPANPSLSMSLKKCSTQTRIKFDASDDLKVSLKLDGNTEENFANKIRSFLTGQSAHLPWINNLSLTIETSNTFPHSTGIASSASGMCAFSLCFMDYCYALAQEQKQDLFLKRASFLSRLASGSACRSVYGGFSAWGESELSGSSDEYAIPYAVHSELAHLHDSVLIVSDTPKSVTSRQGHDRMQEHAFAEARFQQARMNFQSILKAMGTGDVERFGEIIESEALSLHAMMMTSPSGFTLLKPQSVAAMELIKDFRQQTKLPLYFTLDAGPNLHLIYPHNSRNKIMTFIEHELAPLSMSIIHDEAGEGPFKC